MTSIDKFVVNVPQRTLDDLQDRLKRTRWADEIDDGWTFGTDHGELRNLVEHWTGGFDWRRQEAAMNRFASRQAFPGSASPTSRPGRVRSSTLAICGTR